MRGQPATVLMLCFRLGPGEIGGRRGFLPAAGQSEKWAAAASKCDLGLRIPILDLVCSYYT
jgi:hypothetical protein